MVKITNQIVLNEARKLGFDLVGFAEPEPLLDETEKLESWLENGFNAGMKYMQNNLEKRQDVKNVFPDVKSVISLGMNYFNPEKHDAIKGAGKISRYAWNKDYHLVIWEKLDLLIEILKGYDPNFDAKSYVDTGPVMDKAWAVKGGLGWLGKHSNVINKNIGSWFFIATIFTNQIFENSSQQTDFCGSCTACIDACPTNAIVDDYIVDSNKCISYLTIENKGDISNEFKGKFENWIFGCDICQDVCPWNIKFSAESNISYFQIISNKNLKFDYIESLSNSEFKRVFSSSPILRTKLKGLKRNAEFLKSQLY